MHATVETLQRRVPDALFPREQRPAAILLPAKWRSPRYSLMSVTIIAWSVRLAAMINLLAFSQRHAPSFIYRLADWVPFEISVGRRILMLLTAILLFVLSSGLERGKRIAWILTVAALAFAPLIHLGRAIIWPQLLLNLSLILVLCANHRYFVAASDRQSLRSALIICPILLLGLMIFGTIRLHDLRFETSGPDSWLGCLQAAGELVLVQNAHTQQAQTHQALLLFSELRIGGTSIALLALFLTLRPALKPRESIPGQEERLVHFVRKFGADPLHAYALLGDKIFFFDSSRTVIIPYVMSSRFAVTLGGPIGPAERHNLAVREFVEFCRRQDWVPIFYQVTDESLPIYRLSGFSSLKIGEDARIDTALFDLKGGAFQNLRTLCNNARKRDLKFLWYDASLGVQSALEDELAEISAEWLAQKNGNEMSFDMGSFSREEIRRHGVGVALDANGRALAFTTWRHFGGEHGMVLDLMRARSEARNVLDFVLVESIRHCRAQGVSDVSLGNAPLANATEEYSPTSVEDRAVRFIYENLNHVYAYKPLFEFKRKYRPQWRGRYLAYPAGESLPLIGLALVRVHTRQGRWKFLTG